MIAELEKKSVEAEPVGLGAVEAVSVQVQHYCVPLTQALHLYTLHRSQHRASPPKTSTSKMILIKILL
jgi:hypothetical protein